MHGSRRDQLVRNLLLDIARDYPSTVGENLVLEITLSDVLASCGPQKCSNGGSRTVTVEDGGVDLSESAEVDPPGIIEEDDILRFGLPSARSELGPTTERRLAEKLDKLMLSMTEFFHADADWDSLNEQDRIRLAWALPEDIRNYKASVDSTRSEANTSYARIEDLIDQLVQAHSQLQASLSRVIATYSPEFHSRRGACNELLAAKIEASLIKLSLIRARATRALYDHRPSKTRDATLAQAVSAAQAKLKADARKMTEEEAALDRQLAEYEMMLKLVDGDGGGFAQVIEDWTRVQKEREECIKDLRRLGWTGD
ncbi:hypothetical protein LshimejAT787_1003690 [Lyophyllum shimeji]|uniref:Uncharacterized protein n=1 Tax=Lyophyllum shimeji TaxID=47721 RepID=A0A9P3UNM2_LYOSH|nr:hypothetical protein LshimejAT787_1003690 [Lyophyllum shimeji]